MTPEISIAVPVYNTGKYLPACLDSVLSQSMRDFEIIAVNDASTDNAPEILSEYAAKDPRIRIINHEQNKGLLAARRTGILAAKGKYIMFLDSDDCFLPGFLKKALETAEKTGADIVNSPIELRIRSGSGRGKLVKYMGSDKHSLYGKEVFRKHFVENGCLWALVSKIFLTELCRKAIEHIPDQFCLMGEDFCFYTICSFFARHYEYVKKPGYIYYTDSGISSFQKTGIERFINRQSPFQAFRNVQIFLQGQNVWEEYADAFARQEQTILADYIFRWMHYLSAPDRTRAFNCMFRHYDAFPLFLSFRTFFSNKDEKLLELLTGEDSEPMEKPERMNHIGQQLSLRENRISDSRWKEWVSLVRRNRFDAVILEPDDNLERLLWDISAVKSAGASAVCRQLDHYSRTLEKNGLKQWLMEDRVMRQASAVLVSDEESLTWYRHRNCHAGFSLNTLLPPQYSTETSALVLALEKSEQNDGHYRIDPPDDGETFVPFFRKLDHLFRKLPDRFRRKTFRFLSAIYNHAKES